MYLKVSGKHIHILKEKELLQVCKMALDGTSLAENMYNLQLLSYIHRNQKVITVDLDHKKQESIYKNIYIHQMPSKFDLVRILVLS